MPSQEGQRFALMLSQCCVTLGTTFTLSETCCPYGSQISQRVKLFSWSQCFLCAGCGFGGDLPSGGQKWGVGSSGLCHTAVGLNHWELGLDGCGLHSFPEGPGRCLSSLPPLKAPAGTGRQAGPGTFHFLCPRPCPQVPTASSVI